MSTAAQPRPGSGYITAGDHAGRHDVRPDQPLVVGRDPSCDLSFPDEARLSRRAVHVTWNGLGIVIANISSTHGLVVTAAGTSVRLPSVDAGGQSTGFFLSSGRATVTGPAWPDSPFGFSAVVRGTAGPLAAPGDGPGLGTTHQPLHLNPRTKEFATVLLLCRGRLEEPAHPPPPPPIPQLTRQLLEATNSWHLLRRFEIDDSERDRLTGQVHEHLKGLRAKILRHGLVPPATRLTPAMIVDILLASEAVSAHHLRLLDDADWIDAQERLWWSE